MLILLLPKASVWECSAWKSTFKVYVTFAQKCQNGLKPDTMLIVENMVNVLKHTNQVPVAYWWITQLRLYFGIYVIL